MRSFSASNNQSNLRCSASVIEFLKHELGGADSSALAYFYFSFKSSYSSNVANCLRSLISQLSRLERRIPVAVLKLFQQFRTTNGQPDHFSLLEVLLSLIKRHHRTYIIIDALDEAANGKDMVEALSHFMGRKPSGLHLLISSRLDIAIKEALSPLMPMIVSTSERSQEESLLHIQQRIQEDPRMKHWEESLKREFADALVQRSESK